MNKIFALSKTKSTLIFLVILTFVLRFWGLGSTPPSLYWDEVSQGYNAYSILQTGRDEHKEFMPFVRFQAFGDYKAPVYIYSDVISLAIFGNSEFAIRFPSALFGSLTVLLVYFLAKQIFLEHKKKELIACAAMFLLSISPWHIQLSRVAYEANIATFFAVGGVLFFLLARKNIFILLPSVIFFVISFYSFNAHRIFIPLLVLLLVILFWREFLSRIKTSLLICLVGFILLLPFIYYLRTPESRLRFNEVNIFTDISQVELSNNLIKSDDGSMIGKIFHNRRVLYGLSYVKHYFDFQNPTYLFFKGDQNPRFSTQENGQLYLFTLPFILLGMYLILKSRGSTRYLLFGWFILAPIAAATARETPHALRSETFIPIYELFAAFGFVNAYLWMKRLDKKVVFVFLSLTGAIAVFSFINFLHMYFVHMPIRYSQDWQYGYRQAVLRVEEIKDEYDQIIFTNAYGRAYIYVLWYGNYHPSKYWEKGIVERDVFGFYNVHGFDKYKFTSPKDVNIESGNKVLFVSEPYALPDNTNILDRIKFLDGSDAFIISESI